MTTPTKPQDCVNAAAFRKSVGRQFSLFGVSRGAKVSVKGSTIWLADVASLYHTWEAPTAIVVDGPYGVGGFPGDPPTPEGLADWYEPHVEAWARQSTPQTTLWFWNTEIGWASVHPVLVKHGWEYRCAHIWDKGVGHIAGNANSKSLRKLPVVSEMCVQYVRKAEFPGPDGPLTMQQWLRCEWERSGLPLALTNEACGVRNAATRKYFTRDHLFYYPPVDAFCKLVDYANTHGRPQGAPYFSLNGVSPLTGDQWEAMRAKFKCEVGVTNVWHEPAVRGGERMKNRLKCIHLNQKPLKLMELILRLSTDPEDLIWEPFGGLCTAAVAAVRLDRRCNSAEILPDYFEKAVERLESYNA